MEIIIAPPAVYVIGNHLILSLMVQEVIVGIGFAGAVFYVGQLIYKSLQSKSACTSGCGKCGALDFQKIEAQIKKKGI